MAQKFKLIERKNLGKDNKENPRKFYAQAVNNGYVSFDELCGEIAENCTLTSADVKAVMDRMNYILDKNLRAGRIVQFGEIGNFRMAVGSTGSHGEGFQHGADQDPEDRVHAGRQVAHDEGAHHLRAAGGGRGARGRGRFREPRRDLAR